MAPAVPVDHKFAATEPIDRLRFSFVGYGVRWGASTTLMARLERCERHITETYWQGWASRDKRPTWVYVLDAPAARLLKIGHSMNARKRLQEVRQMSPVPITILATLWANPATERALHHGFKDLRHHGEWFRDHADIRELARHMGDEQATTGWTMPTYWKAEGH